MRSKIYPWDCWRFAFYFHPFSWRLTWFRHPLANDAEWCQRKGITRWWVKVGPFTLAQDFLL